jgi:hypothetical protein
MPDCHVSKVPAAKVADFATCLVLVRTIRWLEPSLFVFRTWLTFWWCVRWCFWSFPEGLA